MILYLDSSALVSIYARDQHTDAMRAAALPIDRWATSVVAYPEVRGALARRLKGGTLYLAGSTKPAKGARGERRYQQPRAKLDADWPAFFSVSADARLAATAGALASKHALKGFDSIHLASALQLREQTGDDILFLTADTALSRAASTEKFHIRPQELPLEHSC